MVEVKISYQGEKRCSLTHTPSGDSIATDAPKDNFGKGEAFSPTDLMAASLGSCALTTMAIWAEKEKIPFSTAEARVVKEMKSDPRRVGALRVQIEMPRGLNPAQRKRLEEIALGCPVKKSLHPDLNAPIDFIYQD